MNNPNDYRLHTPGPWWIQPMHQEDITLIWAESYDKSLPLPCIARLPWAGHTESNELEANARLIAAAPELLAALEAIIKCLDGSQPRDIPGAIMVAESAIKASTHQEPQLNR